MNPIVDNFFSSGYTHGLRTTLFFEETGFVGQQLVNAEANTVFLEVIKNKEDPSNFDDGINLTVDVFTSFLEFWNRKWPQIEITMNKQISKIRKKNCQRSNRKQNACLHERDLCVSKLV